MKLSNDATEQPIHNAQSPSSVSIPDRCPNHLTIPRSIEKDIESHKKIPSQSALKSNTSSLRLNDEGELESGGNGIVSAAAVKAISACILYSFCSFSMILANKSLASRCVCLLFLCEALTVSATITWLMVTSTFYLSSFKPSLLSFASKGRGSWVGWNIRA